MIKVICCECGKRRPEKRAIVKHLNGVIDRICGLCWHRLEMAKYFIEAES